MHSPAHVTLMNPFVTIHGSKSKVVEPLVRPQLSIILTIRIDDEVAFALGREVYGHNQSFTDGS
jgi:hypothetical protein